MRRAGVAVLLLGMAGHAAAHDGDSEERAMRMHGLLLQLDRTWAAVQKESDPARRDMLLAEHTARLQAAREALQDISDKSSCILLEARDTARQLACLTDIEARQRATEKLLGHAINRLALPSLR